MHKAKQFSNGPNTAVTGPLLESKSIESDANHGEKKVPGDELHDASCCLPVPSPPPLVSHD